ncbi:MAG TPA: hypothetical protein VI408_12555 [Gaiellaceae bacterium]
MTRVAAIDLGTNATRLLVADVAEGRVDEVRRETRITRLGEGVDARRRLLPVPIARVRNVLSEYRRIADELGAERVLAVATSAVRDAENGEAFLGEVEWSYGFATALLTGDDEARTTLRGVGALDPGTVVVDIGGGSTELITERFHTSLDIGCVRLTERHGADFEAMAADVRAVLPELEATHVLNVDGTTAELAHLYGEVTLEALGGFLSDPPTAERLLQPARAEVLPAGAVILRETLVHLGVDRTAPSTRDLLTGAALAAADLPAPAEGEAPPGAFTCC